MDGMQTPVLDIFARLAAPFPPAQISWRVGSKNKENTKGMALAYIDARDVMYRLDDVMGPANWQCDYPWSDGKRLVCRIGLRIDGEWIWKSDGAGETDVEAEKGAMSDAFKRAAVRWSVGRYLYDMPSPWVEIVPAGRSYRIADGAFKSLEQALVKNGGASAPPDPQTRPTASAAQPVAKPTSPRTLPVPQTDGKPDWRAFGKTLAEIFTAAQTREVLNGWWVSNDLAIADMRAASDPLYTWVEDRYNARLAALPEAAPPKTSSLDAPGTILSGG